jgi:hypothetical protein
MEYIVVFVCLYMQMQIMLCYSYTYDITFKIKQIIYSLRDSTPLPIKNSVRATERHHTTTK